MDVYQYQCKVADSFWKQNDPDDNSRNFGNWNDTAVSEEKMFDRKMEVFHTRAVDMCGYLFVMYSKSGKQYI